MQFSSHMNLPFRPNITKPFTGHCYASPNTLPLCVRKRVGLSLVSQGRKDYMINKTAMSSR
ncbi:hypothetical protein NC652_010169 [Populus alba x Populus x berolinensis]|nr:hypothetical protein NC652_010169 [Populus alba x Populus x berolinensis]